MKHLKLYEGFLADKVNETSLPPPRVLHTLLVMQTQLKLAHWQTKSFSQHKALDEAYATISEKSDLLAESYIGKYGDSGRYLGFQHVIGLMDYKEPKDFQILADVLKGSLNMCAMCCLKDDSELMNIVEEINAELDKLKYLFTLE